MTPAQLIQRVLILDDERLIADTLALILDRNGFAARAVYSAQDAISAAHDFPPDFLISDVIMQGMTGLDAAIRIAEIVPHCRIILFSGQASTADLLEKAEEDGHHFELLTKPVHPRILIQRLSQMKQAP
jgi:CheY-like chemotaxis protein